MQKTTVPGMQKCELSNAPKHGGGRFNFASLGHLPWLQKNFVLILE
jgi:hypothetical protein